MANNNDLIQVKTLVDEITASFLKQNDAISKAAESGNKYNKEFATLPSQFNSMTNSITEQTNTVKNNSKAITENSNKIQNEIEKQRLSEIKLQQTREKSFDNFSKNNAKETQAIIKQSGSYNQLQGQIKTLTEMYNNLAAKKALGNQLSQQEQNNLEEYKGKLNSYRGILKQVDADVQSNQRNVGNYSSVFTQAKEAGNQFTNLLSTVFSKVRILAYILPGIGIGGIFGLALDPLFKYLSGIKAIQEAFGIETAATKAAKKAIEEKVKAEQEQNKEVATSIAQETTKAKILFELAKNENNSMAKRNQAFDELKSKYGQYLGDLTRQEALSGQTAEAEERLNQALLGRGMALAIQNLLVKNAEKQAEEELKYSKILKSNSDTEDLYDLKQEERIKQKQKIRLIREDEIDNLKVLKENVDANTDSEDKHGKKVSIQSVSSYQARSKALIPLKEEEKQLLALFNRYSQYLALDEKNIKGKKEHTHLTFEEVKSESELAKAILERQRIEISDRMNNDKSLLEDRVKAREEYSKKSIEILNIQIEEEKAILALKYRDDLKQNNLAYKNKTITAEEFNANIFYINRRYNNEIAKSDADNSIKWNYLMNENSAFYKKIQDEKLKFTQDTEKLILDAQKNTFEKLSKNEGLTLELRQKAFLEYTNLARKELDIAKLREISNANSQEEIDFIIQKYKGLNQAITDIASPIKIAKEEFQKFLTTTSGNQLDKALKNIGLESAKMFLDFDEKGETTFSKLFKSASNFKEKFAVIFKSVSDVAMEAYALIAQSSQKNFDDQYANLEQQKSIAITFAGESSTAKAEIERQYEEKRKEIANRQAKAKKDEALFNIALSTAQGVVSALASTPPNIPLSIAVGVIGLAELAFASSIKVPQFYKGTDNAPSGLAIVDELRPEIHTDSKGNIKSLGSEQGANFRMLDKGDKIYKSHNDYLNEILSNNGIAPFNGALQSEALNILSIGNNNGLTKADFQNGISKLASTIKNKAEFELVRDARGERVFKRENGSKIEQLNNHLRLNGKRIS